MTETARSKPPVWYWLVSVIGLLWYLMDFSAFYMRVFSLNSLPELQQSLYTTMPAWVNVVFALEVFGGLLGCIGLLLRKRWSLLLLCVSLLGVMAQSIYVWFLSDAVTVMGNAAVVMPLVAIVIASVLIVVCRHAIASRWLH